MADREPLDRPFYAYLRCRIAALLIAHDGRLELKHLRTFLRQHGVDRGSVRRPDGSSNGSKAGQALANCMRVLYDEGLCVREGDAVVVPNLADLAAWLADEVDDDYRPPPPMTPHEAHQRWVSSRDLQEASHG